MTAPTLRCPPGGCNPPWGGPSADSAALTLATVAASLPPEGVQSGLGRPVARLGGRKSVTEYAGGKGPRQRIWETIRKLAMTERPFSDADILRQAEGAAHDINISAIREYRAALVAAGVIAEVTAPVKLKTKGTYRLARDLGIEAPRYRKDGTPVIQGRAQEQMWLVLRMMSGDTNQRELAAYASVALNPVSEVAAKAYLQTLRKAGYLICTRLGTGCVQARYRLKPNRNTGPRPPMICKTKAVYDPNEGRVVWARPVTDEDAIYGPHA